MVKGTFTPLEESKRNYSDAQRKARAEAEKKLLKPTEDKPKASKKLTKDERRIFNYYVKLDDGFCLNDSGVLTALAIAKHQYDVITDAINDLDVFDPQRKDLEKRAQAYHRDFLACEKELKITRSERAKLVNEEMNRMLKEQELEQKAKTEEQPKNPLLEVLSKKKGVGA